MKAEQSIARIEECFNIILSYMANKKVSDKEEGEKVES